MFSLLFSFVDSDWRTSGLPHLKPFRFLVGYSFVASIWWLLASFLPCTGLNGIKRSFAVKWQSGWETTEGRLEAGLGSYQVGQAPQSSRLRHAARDTQSSSWWPDSPESSGRNPWKIFRYLARRWLSCPTDRVNGLSCAEMFENIFRMGGSPGEVPLHLNF